MGEFGQLIYYGSSFGLGALRAHATAPPAFPQTRSPDGAEGEGLPLQGHVYQPVLLDSLLVQLHYLLAQPLLILAHHLRKRNWILRPWKLLRGTDGAGGTDASGGDPL